MKNILLFVFLCVSQHIISQGFEFRGVLTTSQEEVSIEGLHIFNKSTKLGTVSSNKGFFSIQVRVNDSLYITGLQIIPIYIRVYKKHINTLSKINITNNINELSEVFINNKLSGFLNTDSKNVPKKITVDFSKLGIPNYGVKNRTVAERRIYTATTSGGGIPLDAILNRLSGRLKILEKELETERKIIKVNKFKAQFSKLIIENYEITDNNVNRFIEFCSLHSRFNKVIGGNKLEVLVFIEQQVQLFNKLK